MSSNHSRLLFVGLLCLLNLPAHCFGQEVGTGNTWLKQKLSIQAEKAGLAEVVALIADATNHSVLAEGQPLSKSIEVKSTGTVEEVLTEVCHPFDYTWTLSKSGVVLLRKQFVDRSDLPECDPAEMKAACRDVLDSVRAVYPESDPQKRFHDLLPVFVRSLDAEQQRSLRRGANIKVGDLPPAPQRIAKQVIYGELLDRFYESWFRLQTGLQDLPRSSIRREIGDWYVGSDTHPVKVWDTNLVMPSQEYGEAPISLGRDLIDPKQGPGDLFNPPPAQTGDIIRPTTALPAPSVKSRNADESIVKKLAVGACTAGQLVEILRQTPGTTITLASALQNRRIISQMRNTSVDSTLSALAELHEWSFTRAEGSHYLLLRRNSRRPETMQELGEAVKISLPADFKRFVLAEPAAKEKEIIPPTPDRVVLIFFNRGRVNGKLEELINAEKRQLDRELRSHAREKPIPYSALSITQQRQCARFLTLTSCQTMLSGLTDLLTQFSNSYAANPAEAKIYYTGTSLFFGNFGSSFDWDSKKFATP